MSAAEKILIAEETVAGFQRQLKAVEAVLETAEQVAVKGARAGRWLRRLFRVLLILSAFAVVAMILKKVMGGRFSTGEESAPESESTSDDPPNDDGGAPAGDEVAPDGDATAS